MANISKAKTRKLLDDPAFLRKQLSNTVRDCAITPELLDEARRRIADPRMTAFNEEIAYTLALMLTPTDVFNGLAARPLFGKSPVDAKMHGRLGGTVLEDAWGAPMVETPAEVLAHLRPLLVA